jgi:DNA relaxase NicK
MKTKLTILALTILLSLSSCSVATKVVTRQKELMAHFKREQSYLRYQGKPTRLQKMKEQQVLEGRKIRQEQRKKRRS